MEQHLVFHYNCVGAIFIPNVFPLPAPQVSVNTRKGVIVDSLGRSCKLRPRSTCCMKKRVFLQDIKSHKNTRYGAGNRTRSHHSVGVVQPPPSSCPQGSCI